MVTFRFDLFHTKSVIAGIIGGGFFGGQFNLWMAITFSVVGGFFGYLATRPTNKNSGDYNQNKQDQTVQRQPATTT